MQPGAYPGQDKNLGGKEMKTLRIDLEKQYPLENQKYALVAYSNDNNVVIKEGGSWTEEDAIDSIQGFAEDLIAKGYKISKVTIKKWNLQLG